MQQPRLEELQVDLSVPSSIAAQVVVVAEELAPPNSYLVARVYLPAVVWAPHERVHVTDSSGAVTAAARAALPRQSCASLAGVQLCRPSASGPAAR